ncbi:MAG: hypothetical protein H7Z72_03535 [Bacteroidetes bacterium]|nr:hypothetical protein [Fibrella sp.]
MKPRALVLWLVLSGVTTGTLSAQKLTVETYRVTVVTKTGERSRGIFDDVTPTALYHGAGIRSGPGTGARAIPLEKIRKVVLRRANKRLAIRTGAIVGGVAFGLLTAQGLQKNPTRNPVAYGLTLLFGAGTGAVVGAGAGALVGTISHRVIRPRDRENSLDDFRRQLEPFTVRYQDDVFNRINQ